MGNNREKFNIAIAILELFFVIWKHQYYFCELYKISTSCNTTLLKQWTIKGIIFTFKYAWLKIIFSLIYNVLIFEKKKLCLKNDINVCAVFLNTLVSL